ncbi:hypothetical protein GC176_19925 [bacterium]|nr:hypothetical protein [bacterium]
MFPRIRRPLPHCLIYSSSKRCSTNYGTRFIIALTGWPFRSRVCRRFSGFPDPTNSLVQRATKRAGRAALSGAVQCYGLQCRGQWESVLPARHAVCSSGRRRGSGISEALPHSAGAEVVKDQSETVAGTRPVQEPLAVTLALGGGGARGISHLGVIEGVLSAGCRIDRILGISIGSLAAAMFAFDPDIQHVQKKTLDYLSSPSFQRFQHRLLLSRSAKDDRTSDQPPSRWERMKQAIRVNYVCQQIVRLPSLLKGELLHHATLHLLPEANIEDAEIPLSVVAVDLLTGDRVVLTDGPVREAVRGSSSIPGIFPPVELAGKRLCDIGVLNSLPIPAIDETHPKTTVIAVDVSSDLVPIEACSTAVDVLIRMHEVGERLFREQVRREADILIRPEVGHRSWFEFGEPEQMLELGREAARRALARKIGR